jgi:hypothetical protein
MFTSALSLVLTLILRFARTFSRRFLFEMVTLYIILEAAYLAVIMDVDYELWPLTTNNQALSNDLVYSTGLAIGGVTVTLPLTVVAAVKPPPKYALVALLAWAASACIGGYSSIDHSSSFEPSTYIGWVVLLATVTVLSFWAVRSEDYVRRINFVFTRQLQHEHIEIVADIDDPFRPSNLRQWISGANHAEQQEPETRVVPSSSCFVPEAEAEQNHNEPGSVRVITSPAVAGRGRGRGGAAAGRGAGAGAGEGAGAAEGPGHRVPVRLGAEPVPALRPVAARGVQRAVQRVGAGGALASVLPARAGDGGVEKEKENMN